jgi:hypothetical protein
MLRVTREGAQAFPHIFPRSSAGRLGKHVKVLKVFRPTSDFDLDVASFESSFFSSSAAYI